MCALGISSRRSISVFMLAMLNVSIMASLRTLPMVAEMGFSMVFFFLLVALVFLLPSALVSAELATGWSRDGGVYVWVREALGDRWGFFSVWIQWIHSAAWYPAILSFVAATLAYIFNPDLADNKIYIQTMVLVIFWGMTLLNYYGIKTSTLFSTVGVIVGTILPGLVIIFLAIFWLSSGHQPAIEFNVKGLIPDFSKVGNLVFLAGLFLAFGGMEVTAGYASNVKDPQKNFPRAIAVASMITLSIFVLGSLSISVVIPKNEISLVSGLISSIALYLNSYGLSWLLPILSFMIAIGAVAEVNSWIIGPVRALYVTSTHGNLPPCFQKLNSHGTPTRLLLLQGLIVTVASFAIIYMPSVAVSFWVLTAMSAQIYLFMYMLMFISAIKLRYSHPHIFRAYRIPHHYKGIWIVSIVGICASMFGIFIGFVPPTSFTINSLLGYDAFLLIGTLTMVAVPLVIYQCRKPSWVFFNS